MSKKLRKLTGKEELQTRAFWGVPEIATYRDQPISTVYVETQRREFPLPEVVLGTRGQIKAWRRQVVIDWYKARG